MADVSARLTKRVLDPLERISEILFGLIMALTCTGAIAVATADQAQVRTVLIGALGCNLAWGIIDGGMYLMARVIERGRDMATWDAVRETAERDSAHRIIADAFPPLLASVLQPEQLELICQRVRQLPVSGARPRLTYRDWFGALGVCLLVVASTFPLVIPFIVFENTKLALRASNSIAVILLFLCGYILARYGGLRPWRTGLTLVVIGSALVGVAIALGG